MADETRDDQDLSGGGKKKSRLDELLDEIGSADRLSDLQRVAGATSRLDSLSQLSDPLEHALCTGEELRPTSVADLLPFDVLFPLLESFELKPEPARDFYDALQKEYDAVAARLDPDEQLVILHFDAAGNSTVVHQFAYRHPELLLLYGENRTIIANVNSLQLSLHVVKVMPENKREIGFN